LIAEAFTLDGKIAMVEDFTARRQAREAAGLSD
jgi:hypothetical protein